MVSRYGLLMRKVGSTRVFDEVSVSYRHVTVLSLEPSFVLSVDSSGGDYCRVLLGFAEVSSNKVKKPQREFYKKIGCPVVKRTLSFLVKKDHAIVDLNVGDPLSVDHFLVNQFVDVSGVSIGKGFAGAMKRHNFRGLRATHGVSLTHRSHGSTGQRQDPGKVMKGKKMAGHLGASSVTIQNLRVFSVDVHSQLIGIYGAVPGNDGGYVLLRDAVKKVKGLY